MSRGVCEGMRTRSETVEHDGELNTLPYLDVLMNLIIFMLLSMTGLATYGVINATTSVSQGSGTAEVLQLRVTIHDQGFTIQRGDDTTSIEGRDYTKLTAALGAAKIGTADTRAVLSAAPETPYEVIVATLDAMRGGDGQPLFPDVALDRPR